MQGTLSTVAHAGSTVLIRAVPASGTHDAEFLGPYMVVALSRGVNDKPLTAWLLQAVVCICCCGHHARRHQDQVISLHGVTPGGAKFRLFLCMALRMV